MKTATVEVNGEEWELDNKPLMGTVRHVQQMQMEMFQDNLSDKQMQEMVKESDGDEISEEQLMQKIVKDKGMAGMANLMWEQSMVAPLQTICLASDRKLSNEDVDSMPAPDFMKLKEKSREVLDGNAKDFLNELGIDTSSMLSEEEMEEGLKSA